MRQLAPLTLREKYFIGVEAEIARIFYELMYAPLIKILREYNKSIEITNTASALLDAIKRGTVWYYDEHFHGQFNSRISKALVAIGARYNLLSKTWALALENVPSDLKFAQATADARYDKMRREMITAIDNMDVERIHDITKTQEHYEQTLGNMETDFQKTIPADTQEKSDSPATGLSRITIEAKLTPEMKKRISIDWANNLDMYIKGWAQNNILKLREEIQPHVLAGGRAEALVGTIQSNYGVSQRKAKFLARQETALLMSKFQETRYADIGIEKYRWSDSHDKRVRHDHHELNGKVYRFDSPPVSNKKTGARNNPGQDFGCRCIAIPVFD